MTHRGKRRIGAVVLVLAFLAAYCGSVGSQVDRSETAVGFLDPFTLEVHPTDIVQLAPPQGPAGEAIVTPRMLIRIPYRPPLRSPFVPSI